MKPLIDTAVFCCCYGLIPVLVAVVLFRVIAALAAHGPDVLPGEEERR